MSIAFKRRWNILNFAQHEKECEKFNIKQSRKRKKWFILNRNFLSLILLSWFEIKNFKWIRAIITKKHCAQLWFNCLFKIKSGMNLQLIGKCQWLVENNLLEANITAGLEEPSRQRMILIIFHKISATDIISKKFILLATTGQIYLHRLKHKVNLTTNIVNVW